MFVYVAKIKDEEVIKIGSSVNFKQRMKALDKDVGIDFDESYVCNIGDGYREVEEGVHSAFEDFQAYVRMSNGGTELFSVDCLEDVLEHLSNEGEVKTYSEAHTDFKIPDSKKKGKLKKHLEEQHKLAVQWLEENEDLVSEICEDVMDGNKVDGWVLQWLMCGVIDAKRMAQLFSGKDIEVKLSLNSFRGVVKMPDEKEQLLNKLGEAGLLKY